jgi:hypothetical protein
VSTLKSGRIAEQNEAYRKGLVLGLTMAEVGILIIFILLLLLVFGDMQQRLFDGMEPVVRSELARFKAIEKTLREVAKELDIQIDDSSETFASLARLQTLQALNPRLLRPRVHLKRLSKPA